MNKIQLDGKVIKLTRTEKMTFFELENLEVFKKKDSVTSTFKCRLWNDLYADLKIGDEVELEGSIMQFNKEYQGKAYKQFEVSIFSINLLKGAENEPSEDVPF